MKLLGAGLASALMIASAGVANAADAGTSGADSWSGPYVGLTVGHAWDDGSFNGNGAFTGSNNKINMNGWTYGAKAGYDFAVAPIYVLGVVADIAHSEADGDRCVAKFACVPSVDAFAYGEMKWFGTLRAKAGVTLGDALVYATGGLAMAKFESRITNLHNSSTPDISDSHTQTGWVLGAGIDYKLIKNISIGLEYLHADFGSENYKFNPAIVGAAAGASGKVKMDIVSSSVSYHF